MEGLWGVGIIDVPGKGKYNIFNGWKGSDKQWRERVLGEVTGIGGH